MVHALHVNANQTMCHEHGRTYHKLQVIRVQLMDKGCVY